MWSNCYPIKEPFLKPFCEEKNTLATEITMEIPGVGRSYYMNSGESSLDCRVKQSFTWSKHHQQIMPRFVPSSCRVLCRKYSAWRPHTSSAAVSYTAQGTEIEGNVGFFSCDRSSPKGSACVCMYVYMLLCLCVHVFFICLCGLCAVCIKTHEVCTTQRGRPVCFFCVSVRTVL